MEINKSITLHFDETIFDDRISKVVNKAVSSALDDYFEKQQKQDGFELLTRQQVAAIYSVSLVTLRDWEKSNIIVKPIRKGSRVYWLKSDIMNDIQRKGGCDVK